MIKPIASVKYNDLVGTASADQNGDISLVKYADSLGIDINKYAPKGVSIGINERTISCISLLCEEVGHSNKTISIILPEIAIPNFFDQFKRMEIILLKKNYKASDDIEEIQLDEIINQKRKI